MTNPTLGEWFRTPILGDEDRAKELGGLVVILPPGQSVPYHYQKNRESILKVLSGEAVELYEDKEYPIQAGDVIFVPAGAKHAVINRSRSGGPVPGVFHPSPDGERFYQGGIKVMK